MPERTNVSSACAGLIARSAARALRVAFACGTGGRFITYTYMVQVHALLR